MPRDGTGLVLPEKVENPPSQTKAAGLTSSLSRPQNRPGRIAGAQPAPGENLVPEQAHEMEENSKCPLLRVLPLCAFDGAPSPAPRARPSAPSPGIFKDNIKDNYNSNDDGNNNMPLAFNTVPLVQQLLGSRCCQGSPVGPARPRGCGRWAQPERIRTGSFAPGHGRERRGATALGLMAARLYLGVPFLRPFPASQVLQGGGLESPTKPKGRPKKNSIPSSEQLSEQERARDAEKPPESLGSPAEVSQEE